MKGRTRPITSKTWADQGHEPTGAKKPQTASQPKGHPPQGGQGERRNSVAKPVQGSWLRSQPSNQSSQQPQKDQIGINKEALKRLRMEGYSIGSTIGEGSYSKVRIAYKSEPQSYKTSKIACKVIDKAKASKDFVSKFLPRELEIWKKISHPNIISMLCWYEIGPTVFVFMELCERGDLLDHVQSVGSLPEHKARQYFRQIVAALGYLHSLDIAHRDLKCENILLGRKDVVKLSDLGFSRYCKNDIGKRTLSETFCGSAAYAAPEILQGFPYNPKMYDIWSLGCVLFIILTATMPYDDSNVNQMLQVQLNKGISFPAKLRISPLAKKLIMHLMDPDVTKRATLAQPKHWGRLK